MLKELQHLVVHSEHVKVTSGFFQAKTKKLEIQIFLKFVYSDVFF